MKTDHRTLIEATELAALLKDPDVAIIDCRWDLPRPDWGAAAYAESHIPGAIFASMDRDLAGPITPETGRHPLPEIGRFVETLSRWGIDERVQVVAYDQNNSAPAARLWCLLRWLGHSRVAVLDGGFAAWRPAGLPVTSAPGVRAPRTFTPRPDPRFIASAAEVLATVNAGGDDARHDSETILVDARAADRFAGKNETVDPVAGHVPGALNHPFAHNLEPSGKFLPPAELRRRWEETLGERASKPERVVAMCGSGVTACHNLLALEIAGLSGARLYAGSWSEWIRDPTRPVAR